MPGDVNVYDRISPPTGYAQAQHTSPGMRGMWFNNYCFRLNVLRLIFYQPVRDFGNKRRSVTLWQITNNCAIRDYCNYHGAVPHYLRNLDCASERSGT